MLTLTTRFETVLEGIVDTRALKSVPILVIGHVAILCPCEEDLENHVEIHRENTEPQDYRLFPVRNPKQRDSECCFGPCLTDQGATGRDIDKDVHAIIPIAIVIAGRILASN
jgi:hypothetical protein